MGEVIDIRRGKKGHRVTLQYCPKTSYELGLEDEQGNVVPEKMAEFMRSAEFYLLCKGRRGLYIPEGKRPSDKKKKGGQGFGRLKEHQPPSKRRSRRWGIS